MEFKNIMNDDIRGICLFLGFACLAYIAALLLLAIFTGVKIVKGISLLIVFSAGLIALGITPQVRSRLFRYLCCAVKQ